MAGSTALWGDPWSLGASGHVGEGGCFEKAGSGGERETVAEGVDGKGEAGSTSRKVRKEHVVPRKSRCPLFAVSMVLLRDVPF